MHLALNGADLGSDFIGRLGGLIGQMLDFVSDNREAFTGIAGAGGFNGGVKGKQIGLARDVID
jgi:hypothetical protein